GSSWQEISLERRTPAAPSVPSTSLANIQNGGKDAGSTPQFGLGPAPRVQRPPETESSAFLWASRRTSQSGALGSFPGTILQTPRSGRAWLIRSIPSWYGMWLEAIPPSASSLT